MAFDTIVFTQEELLGALRSGYTSIALCDNEFDIPHAEGISYTTLGNAKIRNIPPNGGNAGQAPAPPDTELPPPLSLSRTSFSGGSYAYRYVYEYEYRTGSFSSYSSYTGSFSSFTQAFMSVYGSGEIPVNGYGINLI